MYFKHNHDLVICTENRNGEKCTIYPGAFHPSNEGIKIAGQSSHIGPNFATHAVDLEKDKDEKAYFDYEFPALLKRAKELADKK